MRTGRRTLATGARLVPGRPARRCAAWASAGRARRHDEAGRAMTWDSVHDGRTAFLTCMRAMCSPGPPIELPCVPQICEHAELDSAAAILLALLDRGLSLAVSGDEA